MRRDTLSAKATLAEPPTRHVTDRLLHELQIDAINSTYSASGRDSRSAKPHLRGAGWVAYRACKRCGEKDFGRDGQCLACAREYARRRKELYPEKVRASNRRTKLKTQFGISVEEYDAMLVAQGGVCAICWDTCKAKRRLSVDHCHSTDKNRGLLCRACNAALGLFRDNPEALKRAAAYLRAAPAAPLHEAIDRAMDMEADRKHEEQHTLEQHVHENGVPSPEVATGQSVARKAGDAECGDRSAQAAGGGISTGGAE